MNKVVQFLKKHYQLIITVLAVVVVYAVFLSVPIDWKSYFAGQSTFTILVVGLGIKLFSFVFPPFPGGAVVIALIPFIGWQTALGVEFLGNIVGIFITYNMGKYFGEKVLKSMNEDKVYLFLHKNMHKPMTWRKFLILVFLVVISADVAGLVYGTGKLRFSELAIIILVGSAVIIFPLYFVIGGALSA